MSKMNHLVYGVIAVMTLWACKKDKAAEPVDPTPYHIRMTDAPAAYTAVNIDLQAVVVTGTGGSVVMLNVTPGIYNLLDFSNGLDTLIATGALTMSRVEQIRLILGSNNTIVDSTGSSYPLKTPSAQQSGLKLNVHHDLQPGVAYNVLLDFDATQSVVKRGNGDYLLKPVIRTIETAISGSIKGKISQPGVYATVTASSGGAAYSTIVNANGEFVLAGLPAGSYVLTISPAFPYATITLSNVLVTVGSTTHVGLIAI